MTLPGVHAHRLIRLPEVIARTGLSRSSIYAKIGDSRIGDGFPTPVDLGTGRAVAWVEEEVDAWIAKQIARRDSGERALSRKFPNARSRHVVDGKRRSIKTASNAADLPEANVLRGSRAKD